MVGIKNILDAVRGSLENGRHGRQEDSPEVPSFNHVSRENNNEPSRAEEVPLPRPSLGNNGAAPDSQPRQYQIGDDWLNYVDREYPSWVNLEAQEEWEDPKGGRIYWLPNPKWYP